MNPRASVRLPAPSVRFAEDFLPRLGKLRRVWIALRERREGAGRGGILGAGIEFRGFRPYRPGEDLRMLDWALFARHRRPFVRVAQREASERWAVVVDASASMGVGPDPARGKLQLAAELATGIASLGTVEGASVELVISSQPGERFEIRRPHELRAWMARLEGIVASGEDGIARLLREPARVRSAGAVFLIGDFLDTPPPELVRYQRRGREVSCLQILAPEELVAPHPGTASALTWVDAETGEEVLCSIDARNALLYETSISSSLENLRAHCIRHRVRHGVWPSTQSFESVLAEIL